MGWESQPSFRQKCKKAAGGEKGKDKVKLEAGKLQTNPPFTRGQHLNRHCCGVSNAEDTTQQGNTSNTKPCLHAPPSSLTVAENFRKYFTLDLFYCMFPTNFQFQFLLLFLIFSHHWDKTVTFRYCLGKKTGSYINNT